MARTFCAGMSLLLALVVTVPAHALSFGIGLGSIMIKPDGISNLERLNPALGAKLTSPPATYNFQLHGAITDNIFFETGLAILSHIEKEQVRNNIDESEGTIRAYKVSSKETYSTLYGALGLAIFINDSIAIYGKVGGNVNSTEYSVKQVVNYQNFIYDEQNDKDLSTGLDRYLAVGILFNLTDRFLIKVDAEDFGVIGNEAEVSNYYLPNTVDNPEASGSHIRRVILHFLTRF